MKIMGRKKSNNDEKNTHTHHTENMKLECKTISPSRGLAPPTLWQMYFAFDSLSLSLSSYMNIFIFCRHLVRFSVLLLLIQHIFLGNGSTLKRHMKDFITWRNQNCQTLITIMHDRSNFYDFSAQVPLDWVQCSGIDTEPNGYSADQNVAIHLNFRRVVVTSINFSIRLLRSFRLFCLFRFLISRIAKIADFVD